MTTSTMEMRGGVSSVLRMVGKSFAVFPRRAASSRIACAGVAFALVLATTLTLFSSCGPWLGCAGRFVGIAKLSADGARAVPVDWAPHVERLV